MKKLNEYFEIGEEVFNTAGALNRVLGSDCKVFVDPFLMTDENIPEFKGAKQEIQEYFRKVILLIDQKSSLARREAIRRLTFPETKGVGIGYSDKSDDGSSVGPILAEKLVSIAEEILEMGIKNPEIFELIGLFQEDFGPDRLSDMIIHILKVRFLKYTQRISQELNLEKTKKIVFQEEEYVVPFEEERNQEIIFVPVRFLRDLPVIFDEEDFHYTSLFNEELRNKYNHLLENPLKEVLKKADLYAFVMDNPEALESILKYYDNLEATPYDFMSDSKGIIKWIDFGRRFVAENPLEIMNKKVEDIEDIHRIVMEIISQFKKVVEFNNGTLFLYEGSKPLHERYAQKLFHIVALGYCASNNLDISPEVNSGSGAVDFKLSRGDSKVVVEIKKTSHRGFIQGIEEQLPTYQASENAQIPIFLGIRVTKSNRQVEKLKELERQYREEGIDFPEYVIVDARLKPTASKRK